MQFIKQIFSKIYLTEMNKLNFNIKKVSVLINQLSYIDKYNENETINY